MTDHVSNYAPAEPTPDIDELYQIDENPAPVTVSVRLTEAATQWQLPNRRARYDSIIVDDVSWVEVLDASLKRGRATLIAATNPVRIRTSTSGTGLAWPVGVPFPVTHTRSVQVICATAAATAEIGIAEEYWAD